MQRRLLQTCSQSTLFTSSNYQLCKSSPCTAVALSMMCGPTLVSARLLIADHKGSDCNTRRRIAELVAGGGEQVLWLRACQEAVFVAGARCQAVVAVVQCGPAHQQCPGNSHSSQLSPKRAFLADLGSTSRCRIPTVASSVRCLHVGTARIHQISNPAAAL